MAVATVVLQAAVREGASLVDTIASPDPEAELVARVADGDTAAFEALHRRYCAALVAYFQHRTHDRGAAEELTQDTLVAVWRGAGRFERRSTVRTWIYGIARNVMSEMQRQRPLPLAEPLESDPADPAPTPEDAALANTDAAQLRAAVARLNERHREVLALFAIAELSHEEVAEVLHVPIGTVKSRLSRGRSALAAKLAARGGQP